MFGRANVTEILKDQLYLGNLTAATAPDAAQRTSHILSVCPEYPSTGPHHLAVAVDDSEYEDILVHLPAACAFIDDAIAGGGRVLVHCVMGISRSATVVAAYLMKTRGMAPSAALRFIKQRRPQIHPNYGFITQLDVFAECGYAPGPASAPYRAWKRRHERDMVGFMNKMVDTTPLGNGLWVSSDFPADPQQATSLLADLGITHVLSVAPAHAYTGNPGVARTHHIAVPAPRVREKGAEGAKAALLLALPDACAFIRAALALRSPEMDPQVLVHSRVESRACVVACAYLMESRKISPAAAFGVLEDALPLFNPTRAFLRQLERFEVCGYNPTPAHPLVRTWSGEGEVADADTRAGSEEDAGDGQGEGEGDKKEAEVEGRGDVGALAADALSETGYDLAAFRTAMGQIASVHAVGS